MSCAQVNSLLISGTVTYSGLLKHTYQRYLLIRPRFLVSCTVPISDVMASAVTLVAGGYCFCLPAPTCSLFWQQTHLWCRKMEQRLSKPTPVTSPPIAATVWVTESRALIWTAWVCPIESRHIFYTGSWAQDRIVWLLIQVFDNSLSPFVLVIQVNLSPL